MKLRRIIFLLSVLLHLIGLYWIARVEVPMLSYPGREQVINIVPIIAPPWVTNTSPAKKVKIGGQTISKGKTSTPPANTTGTSIGTAPGVTPAKIQGQGVPGVPGVPGQDITAKPKLTTPPLEVKGIEELSIYSEKMQGLLRNFAGRRAGSGTGTAGSTGSSSGAGTSQVSFNTRGYRDEDLSSWGKQVLLRLKRNWLVPLAMKKKIQRPVEIETVIEKSGRISTIKVKISSNSPAFDRSAMNALILSAPLPGLPQDFPNQNLEARFMFTSDLL